MFHAQYEVRYIRSPRTAQEMRANAVETALSREYAVEFRRRSLPGTYEDFTLSRNGYRSWKEAKREISESGAVAGKRIKRRKSWMK